MVLGELAPKNLAIAKPEALARALSRSTLIYLAVAGPLIRLFDATSNRLLRAVGIEPVEELPQGATAEDLDRIIDESRTRRGCSTRTRPGCSTAGSTSAAGPPARRWSRGSTWSRSGRRDPAVRVVELLDTGHTRFPVDRRRRRRRRRRGRDRRRGRPGTAPTARTPPWRRSRRRRVLVPGDAAAARGAGAAARRAPPARLRDRRVRRLRRHRDPGGHRGGAGRRDPRRGRPARAGRRHRQPTAPGGCPAAGGSTRSPTRPASRCRPRSTTTPCPDWCSAGSAGSPRPGDEVVVDAAADRLDERRQPRCPTGPGPRSTGRARSRRHVPRDRSILRREESP